ncbi:hypothetical protein [Streptomyces griseocarneus]|nr:hypothetical protein [Streptomyces griseocarneus]MBZ6476192.1 hypothetical protein [Streptomyces griseocarneus]
MGVVGRHGELVDDMERGRITEQGTFDRLVRAGGLFQELYELSQDR